MHRVQSRSRLAPMPVPAQTAAASTVTAERQLKVDVARRARNSSLAGMSRRTAQPICRDTDTGKRQVGRSRYRIDMVVLHRHEEGRLTLAIECDGAGDQSAPTARDRHEASGSWRLVRPKGTQEPATVRRQPGVSPQVAEQQSSGPAPRDVPRQELNPCRLRRRLQRRAAYGRATHSVRSVGIPSPHDHRFWSVGACPGRCSVPLACPSPRLERPFLNSPWDWSGRHSEIDVRVLTTKEVPDIPQCSGQVASAPKQKMLRAKIQSPQLYLAHDDDMATGKRVWDVAPANDKADGNVDFPHRSAARRVRTTRSRCMDVRRCSRRLSTRPNEPWRATRVEGR